MLADESVLVKNDNEGTQVEAALSDITVGDTLSITFDEDGTITTTQDASGGIHAAGGGKLYAWNLAVKTAGEPSAAIRSDRGGGTMVVDDGTVYVSGDSGFTITVSSYSDSADFSGAATADSWENHQAEKPEAIA